MAISFPPRLLVTDRYWPLLTATCPLQGAIYAYERLLSLEPSSSPGLPAPASAKRGVQELVLLSHRRGVEDTASVLGGLQGVGESSRQSLTSRAMSDVEAFRKVTSRSDPRSRRALTLGLLNPSPSPNPYPSPEP